MNTVLKLALYGTAALVLYALLIDQDKANSLVAAIVAEIVRYAAMVHFG